MTLGMCGYSISYLWRRPALQLSLDRPWESWPSVLLQKLVRDGSILVFRVDKQAIHVEQARPHAGEAAGQSISMAGDGDDDQGSYFSFLVAILRNAACWESSLKLLE